MLAIKLVAIGLLALSQLLDWHSTLAFLKSGKGSESTGWLRRLQRHIGPSRAMILKGLAHIPLAVAVWLLPYWVAFGLLPYLAIYARIIVRNYRIARS